MRHLFFILPVVFLSCGKKATALPTPQPAPTDTAFIIRGMDLSFTPMLNNNNTIFYTGGNAQPILQLVKAKGINTIRIRIWNNPADEHSSLTEVLSFAQQLKAAGLAFWLDFHYSDTWADPGKQAKPAAWNSLSFALLQDSVYACTKNVIETLKQNNAAPDFVQVGNEINSGMLWEDGKIDYSNINGFDNFSALLKQGIKAVRETSPSTKIIIHIAGYTGADFFYNELSKQGIDYDIIGLSYYSWWHGTSLDALSQTISGLHTTYKKPVMIAETGYPFTMGYNDATDNIVGTTTGLISAYPATETGQASFITDLMHKTITASPGDYSGVCYWAPDWVAYKGLSATDGSPWENIALFDFTNNALPAMDSLGSSK